MGVSRLGRVLREVRARFGKSGRDVISYDPQFMKFDVESFGVYENVCGCDGDVERIGTETAGEVENVCR